MPYGCGLLANGLVAIAVRCRVGVPCRKASAAGFLAARFEELSTQLWSEHIDEETVQQLNRDPQVELDARHPAKLS